MMTDKDIKEYHKLIKKLEEQKKEKRYGQQENEELAESYKESRTQTKERQDKGPLDSFSDALKNSIKTAEEDISIMTKEKGKNKKQDLEKKKTQLDNFEENKRKLVLLVKVLY